MFILKDIFLILIGIFIISLVFLGKEKTAISIMVFLLPFGILFPSDLIPIGLNGIIIWSIYITLIIKYNSSKSIQSSWTKISSKLLWLYYILFIGIFMTVINQEDIDLITQISIQRQVINNSVSIISIIFLINILVPYRNNLIFQNKIKNIFILSISLQILPFVLPFAFSNSFTNSLTTHSTITQQDDLSSIGNRFSGVVGDYELFVDYCLIIISLSFSNYINNINKYFYLSVLILTSYLAILSGTRSFLIVFPLFIMLYYIFDIYINKTVISTNYLKSNFIIYLVIFLSMSYLVTININSSIFTRLFESLDSYNQNHNLNEMTNRNFIDLIPEITKISIFGVGSLDVFRVGTNEMVSHNLFFHTYAKYGIIGLILILYLFVNTISLLIRTLKYNNSKVYLKNTIVYLSLFISLFINEMKISFIRYQTSMLFYTFLFVLIYFHISNRTKSSILK